MSTGRVVTYDQLLVAAERLFHRTGGLEMTALAQAVSISRATLYRVAGSRDRLLGDLLWAQGSRLLTRVCAATPGEGVDRLVEVAQRFHRDLLSYAPLRTFLREEPETAVRVLLTAGPGVHRRFVARWRELLEEETARGGDALGLDPGDAAYVFVRLGESLLYSDVLAGREPDLVLAARVQRAVLRA